MTPRYLRVEPDRKETLSAAVASGMLALGVGVVAFYLMRLFLSREAVSPAGDTDRTDLGARRG